MDPPCCDISQVSRKRREFRSTLSGPVRPPASARAKMESARPAPQAAPPAPTPAPAPAQAPQVPQVPQPQAAAMQTPRAKERGAYFETATPRVQFSGNCPFRYEVFEQRRQAREYAEVLGRPFPGRTGPLAAAREPGSREMREGKPDGSPRVSPKVSRSSRVSRSSSCPSLANAQVINDLKCKVDGLLRQKDLLSELRAERAKRSPIGRAKRSSGAGSVEEGSTAASTAASTPAKAKTAKANRIQVSKEPLGTPGGQIRPWLD
ncbi:unnamed protein product [Effrenium voratum]|nr:unnamed protein product [Effrenium voratum]